MATYTKMLLSGSTNGKSVKVAATATAGTLIHTAVTGTTSMDEVWLYAYNGHTADVVLTVEFGGATVPDQNIIQTIPFKQGRFIVCDGRLLNNALEIRAFAATTNVITIDGFVNRIAP